MGYYVQTAELRGKAEQLASAYYGQIIPKPKSFSDIPSDKALIVVLDNGAFEAAGLAYDEKEFLEFTDPSDTRRKKYVLLDKATAYELSGYEQRQSKRA